MNKLEKLLATITELRNQAEFNLDRYRHRSFADTTPKGIAHNAEMMNYNLGAKDAYNHLIGTVNSLINQKGE